MIKKFYTLFIIVIVFLTGCNSTSISSFPSISTSTSTPINESLITSSHLVENEYLFECSLLETSPIIYIENEHLEIPNGSSSIIHASIQIFYTQTFLNINDGVKFSLTYNNQTSYFIQKNFLKEDSIQNINKLEISFLLFLDLDMTLNGDLDLSFYSLNHTDESEQKMSSFTIHYQKQEQHVIFTI